MRRNWIHLGGRFEIDQKRKKISELEKLSAEPNFWADSNRARESMSRLTYLKKIVKHWEDLDRELKDLIALQRLNEEEKDESIIAEIASNTEKIRKEIQRLDIEVKLSGENDINNAIVSIHAGAGGTESCDWAEMLLRMYLRWCEKKGFTAQITDLLAGEEAGVKSVTFLVTGEYAYGYLQAEIGVHRLVRISPFDSNKRRHTSFSSVDVIPEIDDDKEIVIEDKDIRIDTYRASGHGGQYLNKTDSAVRITHFPTGVVVQSQNERSQLKNRVTAMKLLKARIHEVEREKIRMAAEKHYDDKGAIAWGNQIRSYTFMPYQLVKDHRTGKEIPQVDLVMDGEIDPFIFSFLDWKLMAKPDLKK